MSASRSLSRLSSRLQSLSSLKLKMKLISPLKSSSPNPIAFMSRLPVELSCMVSMMPLHSAIASARLTSILSSESQSWGLIPQAGRWVIIAVVTVMELVFLAGGYLHAFMTI